MNLSLKDLRFIIEAIEHQINAYHEPLQVIEDVDEDKAAELGNDIKFVRASLRRHDNNFRAEYFSQIFKLG